MNSSKNLKVWMLAVRPKTLGAGLAPILIGTAMAFAEGKGHAGAALWLASQGDGFLRAKDKDAMMPLHWAAGNGHSVVTKALVKAGAEQRHRDRSGTTPRGWAEFKGHKLLASWMKDREEGRDEL